VPESDAIQVLAYHWVDPCVGERLRQWGVTPRAFEAQMTALAEGGYQVLSLEEVLQVVRGERPASPRTVALTFDDGYRSLLDHALPVLERLGFKATFFVVTDRVGGTNAWDARHGDAPRSLMGWSEIETLLARGMDIGSHSRTHPFLPELKEPELQDEIGRSREAIRERLGSTVRFFSYPHGLVDERCRRAVVAAGYDGACTTHPGRNGPGTDPFALRRTEISCGDTPWTFAFKVRTGFSVRQWAGARMRRWFWHPSPVAGEVAP
jgi:peptidoglycan/xylan/chitin deacetylase (PgdA/CDA1 family)